MKPVKTEGGSGTVDCSSVHTETSNVSAQDNSPLEKTMSTLQSSLSSCTHVHRDAVIPGQKELDQCALLEPASFGT